MWKSFWKGARQLELPPEEIAFVGDTFATDIIGAYRAGHAAHLIFANPGQQCQADSAADFTGLRNCSICYKPRLE